MFFTSVDVAVFVSRVFDSAHGNVACFQVAAEMLKIFEIKVNLFHPILQTYFIQYYTQVV